MRRSFHESGLTIPTDLKNDCLLVLAPHGIKDLWPHQIESIAVLVLGYSPVMRIATGLGKTLVVQVAILLGKMFPQKYSSFSRTSLMFFPTNALLESMSSRFKSLNITVFRSQKIDSSVSATEPLPILGDYCSSTYTLLSEHPPDVAAVSAEFFFGSSMSAQSLRMFFSQIDGPSIIFVDEADTALVSSTSYRPTQLQLANCKSMYPEALMVISSATLSPDLLRISLGFFGPPRPILVFTSLDRPNLIVGTYTKDAFMFDRIKALVTEIGINSRASGNVDKGSILILVASRAEAESLATEIRAILFKEKAMDPLAISFIRPFHAELHDSEKEKALSLLGTKTCRILCCTEASIGQGIDIPSVRLLFLHNMPCSVIAFIQAIGRAGRDGLQSHVFCRQDFVDTIKSYRHAGAEGRVSWRIVMRSTWGLSRCMIHPLLNFIEGKRISDSYRCMHCELCSNHVVIRDLTAEVASLLAEIQAKPTFLNTKQNRHGKELQIIGALSIGSIHFESGRDGGAAASLSNDDLTYDIRVNQGESAICVNQYIKTTKSTGLKETEGPLKKPKS